MPSYSILMLDFGQLPLSKRYYIYTYEKQGNIETSIEIEKNLHKYEENKKLPSFKGRSLFKSIVSTSNSNRVLTEVKLSTFWKYSTMENPKELKYAMQAQYMRYFPVKRPGLLVMSCKSKSHRTPHMISAKWNAQQQRPSKEQQKSASVLPSIWIEMKSQPLKITKLIGRHSNKIYFSFYFIGTSREAVKVLTKSGRKVLQRIF